MSFQSGSTLRKQIERLPDPGARWLAKQIIPESGTATDNVTLFYRNPVDAVKALLSRPNLVDELEFVPKRVWANKEKKSRIYSEVLTGDWAWNTQVRYST